MAVVLWLFGVILAVVMVLIYGGIQPDGLVLTVKRYYHQSHSALEPGLLEPSHLKNFTASVSTFLTKVYGEYPDEKSG